jgi:hypothetical protein
MPVINHFPVKISTALCNSPNPPQIMLDSPLWDQITQLPIYPHLAPI